LFVVFFLIFCSAATVLVVLLFLNLRGGLFGGDVGAFCVLPYFFIAHDSDYAQLANSVHCPTVVILGEANQIYLSPFKDDLSIHYLASQNRPAFDWEQGISVQEVTRALEEKKLL
ncbi:MAG: hypothetical protein AAF633_06685, partial [Chloroflexota bacterium]